MTGALLWNHWFWVTILTGSQCWCESLLIQPYNVPAPVLQRFATGDLAREVGQGETDDDGEPFIASDEGRNVMVSKSVSVSRVSVEIGGVRVGKEISAADDEGLIAANISDDDNYENIEKPVKPKSFFQNLILQLKSIAAESSDDTSEESKEAEVDSEFSSPDPNLTGPEQYTLVYRDEDYVDDEELLTDVDLYHANDDLYHADEYLDYNYNYDYDISDTYSDIIDINELAQGDYEDVNNDSIDYNDYSEVEGNDHLAPASENKSVDNLVGEIHATDQVRPSPAKIRSDQARGRSLILPQPDLEQLSEVENDVTKTEQILIVKETETLIDNDEKKVSEMDFVIDFSVSEPILDLNIKIGIFIGVALSVVTITVVVVLVTRRKARSAKLVIDEDHSTTDSQYAFSRPLKNNSNIIQEQFSNNVGKASFYPCDDLHSLDNDSFLTSLETISVKDKFTWD